jgi:tetratricopeptide (TPR) repeat protein
MGRMGRMVRNNLLPSSPSSPSSPSRPSCLFVAVVVAVIVAAATVFAQSHAGHVMPPLPRELIERPLPLRTGIGAAHDAVSTQDPQAQAYYDQGLAYLHSFIWIEAARSFHQALRLDSRLAMADVGLSYAYVELNAPAEAKASLDRARAHAAGASEHDRRHVELRAAQMAAEAAPRDAALLTTYRTALDAALAKWPDDVELVLSRGLAESADAAERGQGSPPGSVPFFERAVNLAPKQFAAHHFLTHAFENAGRSSDALEQGEMYARMAPQVPHARHMFGHELRRSGKIAEAIAEFETADRLEVEYLEREHVPAAHDWHYHHNLDLLATSYQYVGRMTKAEELLKKSFAIPSGSVEQEFNKREWPVFLLGRGRAADALTAALEMTSHPSPLVSAAGHIEAGEAHLALKQPREAVDDANAALRLMRSAPEGAGLLEPALQQLRGELLLRRGQGDQGRETLQQVVKKVRAAPGPHAWAQALFTLEAIARAARESGYWDMAEWAAQQMLEHDPNYAGTHYALGLVARHNGNHAAARAEFDRTRALWAHADPGLSELQDLK